MPTYIKTSAIDTLQLPSDPTCEVRMKAHATWGDVKAAQSAMLKIENTEAGVITDMEFAAYASALVRALIVDWNLIDEAGQPLPVNEESLDSLKSEDGQFLSDEARKRTSAGRPTLNG